MSILPKRRRVAQEGLDGSAQVQDTLETARTQRIALQGRSEEEIGEQTRSAEDSSEQDSSEDRQSQSQRPRRPAPLNLRVLTESSGSGSDIGSGMSWDGPFNLWRTRGRLEVPFEFVTPHSPNSLFDLEGSIL